MPRKEIGPWLFGEYKIPFMIDHLVRILPNLNHPRYKNQNAHFTTHPEPNEERMDLILSRYIIPRQRKEQIKWNFQKGITQSYLFPSLDSLSQDRLLYGE